MDDLSPTPALRPPPSREQHAAADPTRSVWVNASAGTGKTRVLANRMLRLLLAGSPSDRLLCLTFTRAGAAEMASRIQQDLHDFMVLPEQLLQQQLERLLGRMPRGEEVRRAEALLTDVLDLPSGLRIMTIHGFCQSLLRRFPLEAGLTPGFKVIEPRAATGLLRAARDHVLASGRGTLKPAIEQLAVALGDATLDEALKALSLKRSALKALVEQHGDLDGLIAKIARTLGIEPGMTLDDLKRDMCSSRSIDEAGLAAAAVSLSTYGSDKDQARGAAIADWINGDLDHRLTRLADYKGVFLTRAGVPSAERNLITKPVSKADPKVLDVLFEEQRRIADAAALEKALVVAARTAAVLRVGLAIIEDYEHRKAASAALDYDDLIASSRALLTGPGSAAWVRYKLDQQIDHLLIDESQDTSPDQWAIVDALIDDFFSGETGREQPPTLFVVGDEKQSIFGFQGADVASFQTRRRAYRERAEAAGLPWQEVPLDQSFRSAPTVLEVVDAVFADPAMRHGVVSEESTLKHQAFRANARGLVELWPLIEPKPTPDPEPWSLPDDEQPLNDLAERRLARAITEQIRQWIRDGVCLDREERPIRPGDVMVLLRRRGILQELLVQEMRQQNVPVAGADRLVLTDALAVMDLMALGDALLLPEDDLTFATLMRSPLFGLSEQDLFDLAHDRGSQSLFSRLRQLGEDRPVFAKADHRFRALLGQADFAPPFEFYARLLGEGGQRRHLLARLGPAAAQPIAAFLAQTLVYEQDHPPSLQGFLHWLRADGGELKRDPDRPRDEVRVLTVHGAKGLEAPIVFLADTLSVPDLGKEKLFWLENGLPLWKLAKDRQDKVSREANDQAKRRVEEEYRRLLYVAMTRAEERLIVTGWKGKKEKKLEGSWYGAVAAAMDGRLEGGDVVEMTLPSVRGGKCLRYGDLQPGVARVEGQLERPRGADLALPAWVTQAPAQPVADEIGLPTLRASADPATDDPPAASPLIDEGRRRFGRGLLIHRLMQTLPDQPRDVRASVLARYLAKPGLKLGTDDQRDIAQKILTILETPEWAPMFGLCSRAEVPLIGEIGGRMVNGQVDRLAVLEDEVIVLDYKTNRPPPRHPGEVPLAYRHQMAIYRALLTEIYPKHRVRCALLWTEGPDLMILDDGHLVIQQTASTLP